MIGVRSVGLSSLMGIMTGPLPGEGRAAARWPVKRGQGRGTLAGVTGRPFTVMLLGMAACMGSGTGNSGPPDSGIPDASDGSTAAERERVAQGGLAVLAAARTLVVVGSLVDFDA